MFRVYLLSSCLICCLCSVEESCSSEPSQDYHGKLLLTLLRIEDRLDHLEKKVSRIQRRYDKNEQKREETLETFLNETLATMEQMSTNVTNLRRDILDGLDERKKKVPSKCFS